nr:MAG TPA: hypothetical protein [Caudoviricetes sp.]
MFISLVIAAIDNFLLFRLVFIICLVVSIWCDKRIICG